MWCRHREEGLHSPNRFSPGAEAKAASAQAPAPAATGPPGPLPDPRSSHVSAFEGTHGEPCGPWVVARRVSSPGRLACGPLEQVRWHKTYVTCVAHKDSGCGLQPIPVQASPLAGVLTACNQETSAKAL